MKKFKIPKLLLIGLMVLTVATAWANQIDLLTFGSGLGHYNTQTHQMALSIGAPLVGETHSPAATGHVKYGFWAMLSQTQVVSAVGDETPTVRNQLFRNYPNPFNPSTRISFTMAEEGQVRVELYDLRGRKVDTLFEGLKPAGAHSFTYQPRNLASGAYVILMRAGSFRASQRMMLVK